MFGDFAFGDAAIADGATSATSVALDDGGDSWWGGATRCAAQIVLGAVLVANALSAQIATQVPEFPVDESAVRLYAVQDENPAPVRVPAWLPTVYPQPWSFDEHLQARNLYVPQDENPAPVKVPAWLPTVYPQPWSFDEHLRGTGLYVVQDENPAPVELTPPNIYTAPLPWSFEQHERATGLYVVQDENPAPVELTPWPSPIVPPPYGWEQHESIATPATIVDDSGDAWSAWTPSVPPLAPIPSSAILPPAWGFASDDIQPIEDDDPGYLPIVLQSSAPTLAPSLAQAPPWSSEQHENAAGLYVVQDEDPLAVITRPWPVAVVPNPFAFEQHEAPPQIADDSGDIWSGWIPATVARGQTLPPYVAPSTIDGDTPGGLHGEPDEDYWNNPVAPVPACLSSPAPWSFEQHEIAGVVLYPDEDFWQNRVVPVPANFAVPLPSSFEQHEPATGLYVVQDEDPKAVPLTARPTPVGQRLVTAFTADDDLPVGALVDDDPGYQPHLPRVPSSSSTAVAAWMAVWIPDAHEAAPRIADDTGDAWNVIRTPWPDAIAPAPWSFDSCEIPALSIDDDAAASGPQLALRVATQRASQLASVVASQPIADAEDVPVLLGQPDEDFWINAVAPRPMAFAVPAPFAWEPHDIVLVFRTPHHLVADLDAGPRADASLDAAPRTTATVVVGPRVDAVPDGFERIAASLTNRPRVSAQLTINGVLIVTTATTPSPTRVRVHASNVLQLSQLADFLDANAAFTGVDVEVRIVRKGDLTELTPTTNLPAQPGNTGVYAVTLSTTVAPFVKDEVYVAQFSATMKDADLNDVDYYEELELIGAVR